MVDLCSPETFRWSDDLRSLKIEYNEERRTFIVAYNCITKEEKTLLVMMTLAVKELQPNGAFKCRPFLISPPMKPGKFQLSLSKFSFCPKLSLTYHETAPDKSSQTCILTAHFTAETRIPGFPFVTVGDAVDIVELVGMGPKMNTVCLYRLALEHMETFKSKPKMNEALYLYRNKPKEYFDDIFLHHRGIMHPYIKDNNGDPENPINGKLDGLFFLSNVHNQLGTPPLSSPFGPHRILIPVGYMLEMMSRNCNQYFADFYCMDKPRSVHYITVVFTEDGSPADNFCRENLLPLPLDNPFFQLYSGNTRFRVNRNIWVEIFYTKEIDIVKACREGHAVMMKCPSTGTSRPDGIPKDPKCTLCNVQGYEEWKIT